ncbi:MAG: 50S ribosomal protein L13 [Bdellovibrio sp.]|nr:50S ribosomal protein L13 [Bdellovibrio sp.]
MRKQQRSFILKPADADKKWYVVDATDQVVGRFASEIAKVLKGKTNPKYTPNTDSGDYVIIINAEKVKFTGKKWDKKNYYWHTNHIGGIKQRTAREQLEKHPELILYNAIFGMLPKTSLGRKQLTKLKVFTGPSHNLEAQKPAELKF